MSPDPIQRYALLVLFVAQEDNATELVVSARESEIEAIKYKVDGAWYDMSPPPPDILPGVVKELAKMAGFTDDPYPRNGVIDIPFSGIQLMWKIRVDSADAPCVLASNRKR